MPCAADRPAPAIRWAAALIAASLVAACTATGPRHTAPRPPRPGLLPRPVIFAGGGGVVAIFGGSAGGGSRPSISVPRIPAADSSLAITMPLDAYQAVATEQQEALAQASNLLAQRCMAARGFDDSGPAAGLYTTVATLQQIETGGAGLTSLAQAQTFGFTRPKEAGSPGGPAILGVVGESGFRRSLRVGKAYTAALYGFSPGGGPAPAGHVGCLQQAAQQAYGALTGQPVPDPVPQIAQQAVAFTQTDPRIRAVDRAWSACMARHHYRYATPSQAEEHSWPARPTRPEIATAVADVTCKTQANLLNTWLTVEAAYQLALIGQNLAALSQLQANFAPLLRRAEAALAAPATPARPG